jgi:tetratricopeptide (TPR) repeat protein
MGIWRGIKKIFEGVRQEASAAAANQLLYNALQALQNGRYAEAIDLCDKAFQIAGGQLSNDAKGAVLSVKAQALVFQGKLMEARRCLNEMYQVDPKNARDLITMLNPKLGAVVVQDGRETVVHLAESVQKEGRESVKQNSPTKVGAHFLRHQLRAKTRSMNYS